MEPAYRGPSIPSTPPLLSSLTEDLIHFCPGLQVVRIEMQSMNKSTDPKILAGGKKTVVGTLSHIYKENGILGLYRGVTPRIGLGIWQTVCMVWCVP